MEARGIIIVGLPENVEYAEILKIALEEFALTIAEQGPSELEKLSGLIEKIEVEALKEATPDNEFIRRKMNRFRPRWQR